jgi:hypothetical protein
MKNPCEVGEDSRLRDCKFFPIVRERFLKGSSKEPRRNP